MFSEGYLLKSLFFVCFHHLLMNHCLQKYHLKLLGKHIHAFVILPLINSFTTKFMCQQFSQANRSTLG